MLISATRGAAEIVRNFRVSGEFIARRFPNLERGLPSSKDRREPSACALCHHRRGIDFNPCEEISMPTTMPSRTRLVVYWIATASIALEMFVGGTWDLLRTPYVRGLMDHLGYPEYMLWILGAWKILGAIAILAPRFPRLKEWAYAGMIFDLTGAAASHAICREGTSQLVVTLTLALIAMASWALRPENRRIGQAIFSSNVQTGRPQPSVL
jgi:uncharacterized membrane protein YphA (DoxX/SURF4 family)